MKSRQLKVGEYRKVKTWEQLLATDGATRDKEGIRFENHAIYFFSEMDYLCGDIVKLYTINKQFRIFGYPNILPVADFFTNDYYDSNGNEIMQDEGEDQKSLRMILLNNKSMQKAMNLASEYGFNPEIHILDQLEHEANQTLTKIAKLREIEAKQVEIDTKIEEQNKRIEEYEKGEL